MTPGDRIPDELLDRRVSGVNLAPGSLRDQLSPGTNLLVFLRHLGCMFCRETIADLRAASEKDEPFPKPLFFYQGSPTEGRALLRSYWPTARAVADADGELYAGFGIGRGGLMKMFGPSVWAGRSRAAAKGYQNGPLSGDIWRMPGIFLTRGAEVVWTHDYAHAADLPDYDVIRAQAVAHA